MGALLKGKVVVVTGAASGIGRTIAIRAAEHGAKAVIAADIRETPREGGDLTTAVIAALGVPARFIATDVSEQAQVEQLIKAAEEFDGVDVMVCNAGITLRHDGADVGKDDFHRLMSVNVDGVLFGAQAAACQMRRLGKNGSIVLMGGIVGAGITVAYSTSKGAVTLMTKALADALGPDGIRVNAVAPGTIDTALLRETPDIGAAAEGFR
jgi:NAD(P)-dependent dehydrogenase (short-subunit alcohol dehydrogenase family)